MAGLVPAIHELKGRSAVLSAAGVALIPYVPSGTHLFRFMDHRTPYFWGAIEQTLSEGRLYLNSRTNFNDPFDSQPIVDDDLRSSQIREYFEDALKDPLNKRRTATTAMKIMAIKQSGSTRLSKERIDSIKRHSQSNAMTLLDECGLLSLSLTIENPLLWAHYAASFAGICVVFKRGSSPTSALAVCAKVLYVDQRPKLSLSALFDLARKRMAGESYGELADRIFFLSFLHKSSHWSYESEARIFFPFKAGQMLPIEKSEVAAIIVGPKATPELKLRLRSLIDRHSRGVRLELSHLSKVDFRIIVPHTYVQHARHSSVNTRPSTGHSAAA